MRFVVYGAGAVGGVIGARLHAAGHDVLLIARGAHLAAIQERGLGLTDATGRSVHTINAVGHPRDADLGASDVVLLCVKSQHTAGALEDLRAVAPPSLPVVCVQNGVESERSTARIFGRAYGMLVWLPTAHLEPGEVVAYSSPITGLLDAGCYPTGVDPTIESVTKALAGSGFAARPDPAIMRWKYHKLLSNLFNALAATLGLGAASADFGARIRQEALACYAAAGIDCATDEEEAQRRKASGVQIVEIEGQPRTSGSSWQSLARGTGSIESDFLNGEIVLLGVQHGVPTPYNRALQRAAARMATSRAAPGSLTLEDLETLVAEESAGGAATS